MASGVRELQIAIATVAKKFVQRKAGRGIQRWAAVVAAERTRPKEGVRVYWNVVVGLGEEEEERRG